MADSTSTTDQPPRPDPVYVHARREAIEILAAWAVAMGWTIGYCAVFGYGRSVDEIDLVFGVPDWVFWGIAVPWIVASAFTLVFSLFRIKHDPLGEDDSPHEPCARSDNEEG